MIVQVMLFLSEIRVNVVPLSVFGLGSTEKHLTQTNMTQKLPVPDERNFEAEMEDLFGLEDDWDSLSKPSILLEVEGFVDTPTFLGMGFATRGLLSRPRREWQAAEVKGWWYSGQFATNPLN